MGQQTTNSLGDKRVFVSGVNTLIGYAFINDSLKKTYGRSASSSPPGKRSAGNAKSKERSVEISRLRDTLKDAGHTVSEDIQGRRQMA